MYNGKESGVSIDSEEFTQMKENFNSILKNLLIKMEQRGEEAGEITLKLKVELRTIEVEDLENLTNADTRDATVPFFKHDIQSVLQEKEKLGGETQGGCEIFWDHTEKRYVLTPIPDAQTSLY